MLYETKTQSLGDFRYSAWCNYCFISSVLLHVDYRCFDWRLRNGGFGCRVLDVFYGCLLYADDMLCYFYRMRGSANRNNISCVIFLQSLFHKTATANGLRTIFHITAS